MSIVSRLKTADVSEARLGKLWAQAVADAEADVSEEAEGLAELAIVVAVSVRVIEKDTVPKVLTDVLRDAVLDWLEVEAESVDDEMVGSLCVVLDTRLMIVEEGVA